MCQILGRVRAQDADVDAGNSNVTYAIREKIMHEYFHMDAWTGAISAAGVRFDRESMDSFTLHVTATDSLASHVAVALVTVTVRDRNDNYPSISFNSTHYHRFHQISNRISSAYFRLGVDMGVGDKLVDFKVGSLRTARTRQY